MDIFTILWITILSLGLILEAVALFNKRQNDTLSENVWKWFNINPELSSRQKDFTRLRRVLLLAFMVWLTIHFVTGGWV
jgi:hypothetical protein